VKYFPLVWATLWRKKTRTILTLLSIIIAFLLFGLLETVDYAFSHPGGNSNSGADRLITINKYSITLPLQLAQLGDIKSVPGVTAVTWLSWFGAYYQEPKNFVFAEPIDSNSYFKVYNSDYVIADGQMQAFDTTRTGALASRALLKQYGWKVGDKVPLHSTIWTQKDGSLDWTFDIVGVLDPKDPALESQQTATFLFHYEMFDEGRTFGKGNVSWFEERIADPSQSAALSNKIDALFANSANETKTQPAKDFALAFLKQLGDIGFILHAILGAVFFTLLFLTGNTMMQSVRERIPELAVLKTLGFGNPTILGLVVGESLLLCGMGALIGLGVSYAALPALKRALQGVDLTPDGVTPGFLIAVLFALVVSILPAARAVRLNIIDALASQH